MAGSSEKVSGKVFDGALMGRLLAYTRPYRNLFILALVITLALSLLTPVQPLLIQMLLDGPVIEGDIPGIRNMVVLLLGLLFVQAGLTYANTYLTNWLGQSVIRDMRDQVFRHILKLKLSFFDKNPIGMLQTRAISDIETLNDVFSSGLVRILGELLQLFAIIAFMFYTNWKLTLIVLGTIPLMLIATYIFKNKIKVAFQGVREAVSKMNSFLQEHITGMQIVHIFNREPIEFGKFDGINRNLRRAHLKSVLAYSVFFPVVELISALALALLVWYGAGQIMRDFVKGLSVSEGGVTFGVLMAFIMYMQMFFRPIRVLADQFNVLQMGMVSAERIFKILDTQDIIDQEGSEKNAIGTLSGKGISLAFEDVSFAYLEDEWVLKDINLSVNPGEKVALVGATGSGKSTIINLFTRFYEIQKGEIRVNDKPIKAYTLSELRSLIGIVLQDVFLFSGSIRDNITLNNDSVALDTVIEAAKRVGAHGFIEQLPGGYDYNVRERGATLSLGQRQLIAFARVLVYDPKILVLDEATANIDTESEEIIQRAIETVMTGRTSIIIAHRLSTIQKADKIVVLNKGEIQESGTHQELLKLKGAYYRLHELQFA